MGGTASHAMAHKARRTNKATIPRRIHLFCLSEATSIAGVCRKEKQSQKQESPAIRRKSHYRA
jgi:hypothetical protein